MSNRCGPEDDSSQRIRLLASAATFLLLVLGSELGARALVSSCRLSHALDPAGALTSLAAARDFLTCAGAEGATLVLGDSVLGPSALAEHGSPDPRGRALGRSLVEEGRRRGVRLAPLGADGLLLPDVLAGFTPRQAGHVSVVWRNRAAIRSHPH